MDNVLKVGYGVADMTPPKGIYISGYFKPRFAEGVLDRLEVVAIALKNGEQNALIISLDDLEAYGTEEIDIIKKAIVEKFGLKQENIFISFTHTHTSPLIASSTNTKLESGECAREIEINYFYKKLVPAILSAVKKALKDRKEAKMGVGVGNAPHIAFIRRFKMKDGSVATNPGPDNPDIIEPVGKVDEDVNVVRFKRVDGSNIVIANFGNHPDVIGGNLISGDWPRFMRKTVERVFDNTKCIFLNGAQGDVNHVNVHPRGGDLNDMFLDFDDVERGYEHSKYMGRVVAGAVMQAFDKVEYLDDTTITTIQREVKVPTNRAKAEELPLAHKYYDLHMAGKDSEIPYKGMMLTTVVAEAERMIQLENGPDFINMDISGVRIGDVGLIGIPGEPFSGIGRGLKKVDGYKMVMTCCLVNGGQGYFPMQEAYDEGGYESRSCPLKAGVAELFIKEGKKLLKEMK